ncbi:MAG: hypothetical protein LBB48_01330 [Treponema sp.]|jgi:hypothetical protein|nr:hypothetical protein [Treponema sp.]
MTGIDDKYKGANKNKAIPSLDEAAWIAAVNAGLDKPEPDLAPNYDRLPSSYKWNDAVRRARLLPLVHRIRRD